MANYSQDDNRNPHTCNCKPQYNPLYWKWEHSPNCNCIDNPDSNEDKLAASKKHRESRLKSDVEYYVAKGQWYRIQSELLKKYDFETWKLHHQESSEIPKENPNKSSWDNLMSNYHGSFVSR